MVLIHNWRDWWKMLSIRAAGLLIVVDVLQEHLPFAREYIGDEWVKYGALAIIVCRLLAQPALGASGSSGRYTDNAVSGMEPARPMEESVSSEGRNVSDQSGTSVSSEVKENG